MAPHDGRTVHAGDVVLKRIEKTLERATILLLLPAALASHGRLSFAHWIIAPLLVALALWFVVLIAIAVGQRCGLVGTTSFAKSSPVDVFENGCEASKREPPPVVRKADDTLPPVADPLVGGVRVHVAHIPGRGDVRYRIR